MSLNESIIKIRVGLQNSKLKKSGKNKFAGFEYYELSDFLPKLNELMLENGINDIMTIEDGNATLKLIKDKEIQNYSIPFIMFDVPKNKNGGDSMQHIQYLGALNTYYKRYLYLNAFGITDGEVIDSLDNNDIQQQPKPLGKSTVKNYTIQELKDLAEVKAFDLSIIEKAYDKSLLEFTQGQLNGAYAQLLKK
jgi:hypothetical protein